MNTHNIPEPKISLGIVDIDPDGKNGGTKYWCTTTFHFNITDSRESVIAKALEGYDVARKNLKS